MRYITDRKRATGMGAAHTGTQHHWQMMVSSVALIGLIVLFVFTFGCALGMEYAEARAYYARPFPSIVALLTLVVGLYHFKGGVQTLIEDYSRGSLQKALLMASVIFSYGLMAVAALSIVRIAL